MLKTNKENLVKWSVQGKIHHPLGGNYRITFDGKPMVSSYRRYIIQC